jgi:peptidoglycan/xylan/chitin deacetylase (PgdA/CDA1 family)/GT2 family glycosyltransferase
MFRRAHAPEPAPGVRHRRVLRPKWVLIVAVFGMFVSVLVTNGLISSEIGVDATGAGPDGPDTGVPAVISSGGPVVDLTSGRTDSLVLPPKTVALTFDDGPDPEWTPQVLAELAKYHVPGTFFVVGSRVAHYPQLARDILAGGSEIGLHTFTHPELREVSPTRVDQEFTATQLALAGATGQLSYLIRPPYSSEANAIDDAGYGVMQQLGKEGYVTALVDTDSNDWQLPGVDAIVNAVTPVGTTGGVVLMHDAGGDRSETIAALDRIIPQLQSEGVRFTTVSDGAGLPAADFAANPTQLLMGRVMLGAVAVAGGVVAALEWSLLVGGGLVLLRLVLMMVVATRHGRRRRRLERDDDRTRWWPDRVSVVVPAFNEKSTIVATVRSLVASDHPVEVIVVDDGSTDGTAAAVEALGLPDVRVIRKPNGGKPSALNAGIGAARGEIVVMMDGDTIFEPSTVRHLVEPFADPRIGAVAGNARVADRRSLIGRWQHIEYVIGFNIDRRVQDAWGVITTVPGAIGAFRRTALAGVGGVSDDTLAEDTDLTIALGRAGWRVVYQPTARAWTDAPASFAQLWRQRYRWSYGIMQSLWKHRRAMLERGHSGHLGRVGLLLTGLFQIVLPLLAPMVDVYLVYGLVYLDPATTGAIWGVALLLQLTAGVVAFRLEGEPLRGLVLLPLQQIVYRQLMYAVLIQSVASAIAGTRLRWQKIPRSGLFSAAPRSLLPPDRDDPATTTPIPIRGSS